MLPSEIPKLPTDLPVRGFPGVWNFSFMTPSPERVSVPYSFVSLFIFYILSYHLLKRIGCLSGSLVSSTSVQKLFCESCSTFKRSFDEFVGEKVVFPSYSSTILGPPSLSAFSKSSLNIWKFLVHVLLKPSLENFQYYFASMWDECNCAVVWAFFSIVFLLDWNERFRQILFDSIAMRYLEESNS